MRNLARLGGQEGSSGDDSEDGETLQSATLSRAEEFKIAKTMPNVNASRLLFMAIPCQFDFVIRDSETGRYKNCILKSEELSIVNIRRKAVREGLQHQGESQRLLQ